MFFEGNPYFARIGGNGDSLWGPILEKAFAKIKGSYAATTGGFTVTGIRALTGAPTFDFDKINQGYSVENDYMIFSSAWIALNAANTLNYILAAETNDIISQKQNPTLNSCGINTGHSYSIISTFELLHLVNDIPMHQMLMIRDPFGVTEWSGNWGYNDTQWTTNFKS